MAAIITITDLPGFTQSEQWMVDDALAMAARVAPCLTTTSDEGVVAAAKAILRRAIMRWKDAGNGAVTQQVAGPFTQTMEVKNSRGLFWPSEINDLQSLCTETGLKKAFHVDTVTSGQVIHADICSINFGATYCSCGASLTNALPLYENLP